MRALWILAAAVLVLAGCTFNGTGFDDPKGEVSVVGEPYEGCLAGRAFYFGQARNTGDLVLANVTAVADLFDGGGAFLGRFESIVSGGVETITIDEGAGITTEVDIIVDSLEVNQQGTFNLRTTVGCGQAARVEYTFTFTTATFEDF